MSKNNWSNRLSFIITSSAFAVGLGNIWRFPYIAGEGGGGAFLLVYLLLIAFIGIPVLIIEIGLGRMSKTTPLLGFGVLGENKKWNIIGWLGVVSCFLIMGYYVMIMAWIGIYFYESISGHLIQLETEELSTHFTSIASDLWVVIAVIIGILIMAGFIVKKGLQAGLEHYSRIMLIGLVMMLLGLTIWASTLDGAGSGYQWFLYPDFSKLSFEVVLSALGQLFFSVGVGMAIAFSFGSYTSQNDNLISSTIWIVLADTFFAVLAGLLIFPALFSFGLAPDSGPNLIFVTMTSVFGSINYGSWVGAIFFLLLFLAGFTSLISSVHGLKDSISDRYDFTDISALLAVLTIIGLISIPVVFSYHNDPFQLFGMSVFGLLDYLTNTIMLPLGGLLIILFAAYKIGFEKLRSHLLIGASDIMIGVYWKFILKFILPIALISILLSGVF